MGEDLSGSIKLPPHWLKTLVCKPIHALEKASLPKTPYELDLKVMDRKPSVVPKVGDKVKIKSQDWYEKWKNPISGVVPVMCSFVPYMEKFLGITLTVYRVEEECFYMEGVEFCAFSMEMFEEVYPKEPDIMSITPTMILSKEQQETLLKQMDSFRWGRIPTASGFLVSSIHPFTETQQKQKLKLIHSRPLLKLKKL